VGLFAVIKSNLRTFVGVDEILWSTSRVNLTGEMVPFYFYSILFYFLFLYDSTVGAEGDDFLFSSFDIPFRYYPSVLSFTLFWSLDFVFTMLVGYLMLCSSLML
jgi:hypothetical protein